jgi:hypothetical protein
MSEENQTEPTEKPKSKKFVLPKEARVMMLSFLEAQNVIEGDAWDDETILKEYNAATLKVHEKNNNYEVGRETKNLNMYASANQKMLITNKEFIARLFNLNVPSYYLHVFKDDDMELNDRDLWKIVNKSGIDPVKEVSQLTKMKRSDVRPKVI